MKTNANPFSWDDAQAFLAVTDTGALAQLQSPDLGSTDNQSQNSKPGKTVVQSTLHQGKRGAEPTEAELKLVSAATQLAKLQ